MIQLKNITKKYGERIALHDVSFTAEDGEILGLLGLNGAGKSTTMNIITGYIGPTSGTVLVDGFDLMEEPLRARGSIGYLPEQPPLYVDMTVTEYLDFVCNLKKVKQDHGEHIKEICAQTGISSVSHRVIKNLSKGYRQRVGLAQALIGNPKVLVLDEPSVGLDPSQILEIRTLIKELGKTRTIIVSSHILSEVQELCTKVVILHQGNMIAHDTPERLSRSLNSPHRVIAWIKGDLDTVRHATNQMSYPCSVELLEEKEPNVYEYRITGPVEHDIRADLFRIMAKHDLPMLAIKGSDLSMEDVFLSMIQSKSVEGGEGR